MRSALIAFALLVAWPVAGAQFDLGALLEGQWRAEQAAGQCTLQRRADALGDLRFQRRAGAAESFAFSPAHRLPAGDVQATSAAPPWDRRYPSDAHIATIAGTGRTLVLGAGATQQLRAALADGLLLVFSADAAPTAPVVVSASGFAVAHAQYCECLARLPPPRDRAYAPPPAVRARVAVRSRVRARVRFAEHEARLDRTAEQALANLLARYRATAVRRVLVAGYSDDTGDAAMNLALSRQRAEQVAAYLRAQGIPAPKIGVRFYGDHYPVADSLSARGRATNRRATVQFE